MHVRLPESLTAGLPSPLEPTGSRTKIQTAQAEGTHLITMTHDTESQRREIRREVRAARRALSPREQHHLSHALCDQIAQLLLFTAMEEVWPMNCQVNGRDPSF